VATGSVCRRCSAGTPQNTQEPTNAAIQGNGSSWFDNGELGRLHARWQLQLQLQRRAPSPLTGCPSRGGRERNHDRREPDNGQDDRHCGGRPSDWRAAVGDGPVALTNLSATAAVGDTFTTGVRCYDSLGASHVVTTSRYLKTQVARGVRHRGRGEDVVGGTAGPPVSIGTGTLSFDARAACRL